MGVSASLMSRVQVVAAVLLLAAIFVPTAAKAEVHNYNVRVASVLIRDTRSRHNDTIYVTIAGYINGSKIGEARWDGTCSDNSCSPGRDMNNGLHVFGPAVSFDTGNIDDSTTIRTVVEVVNSGNPTAAGQAAGAVTDGLAAAACTTVVACAAGAAASAFVNWLFTNCDGPVALASWDVTGAQMRSASPTSPLNSYANFGNLFVPGTDGNTFYGTDSPAGCGHNSNYRVDIGVYRHN